MRKALAAIIGMLALPPLSATAMACSCARNPTAEALLAAHAMIFTGTVRANQIVAPGQLMTTFIVVEPFKGARRGDVVNIYHPSDATVSCGVTFEYGKTYTLAAATERSGLWTSQCSTWMFLPQSGLSGELISRLRTLRGRR